MSTQWLFYKIRLGQFPDAADPLIRDEFSQFRAIAGVEQWFFIRYVDEQDGFHLRLRLKVQAENAAPVRQQVESRLDQLMPLVPILAAQSTPRQSLTGRRPQYQYRAMTPAWQLAEYEPELEKFGHGEALEVAHRWFEQSADLTVAALWLDQQAVGVRNALAYLFTRTVCEVFQPTPSPARFLQNYSYTWLPRNLVQINNFRKQFFRDALLRLEQGQSLVPEADDWPQATTQLLAQWRQTLQQTQQQLRQLGFRHAFIQQQAWQCIHLMNNRLGISPFEESYLATQLEAWYREEARDVA